MKHFRFALSILATASVALLLVALGRQTIDQDPTPRRLPSVSVSQGAPEASPSLTVASAPESADSISSTLSQEQKQSQVASAVPPAVPANNDDEPRHPGDRVDPAKVVARYGNAPLTTEHKDVKAAIEIQERNNKWLMANPAVVGTGIGLNDDGELALLVYTKVDAPELPKSIEGLPVATHRTGPIFARNRLTQDPVETLEKGTAVARKGPPSPVDTTARFNRPVPIGVSTGHPDITAGTIGCRVTKDGVTYALSNNHVYANENLATVGNAVIQPGTYDQGSSPADDIGTLAQYVPITFSTSASNTVDAAIALSSTANLGNATPSDGYGTPKTSFMSPAINMKVVKYGRTTHNTTAQINSISVTVNVGYDQGVARFVGQIYINGSFSAGGDSGSLILCNDRGANKLRPVGLLFAGSSGSTIGNVIGDVLSAFGVTIDGN